ncbi:MAG: phage integrase N-terminal SAM-like domain-containing protein [Ignavibacteria bacterium]|nr:phage integrase N-terminal SAM-like domain-containing protein [Ignavibacteria bacterium]
MNFVYAINGFLKIINESTKIQNIQSKDLTMYLNTLKKTVSNGTQRTYYTYIKLFFNYLVKEDLIDKSPCRNVDPPQRRGEEIVF